jgi:aromatic ring hydroxylase
MPSHRPGLGAMREVRKDLRAARKDKLDAQARQREAQQRIEWLENAEASLRGEPPASTRDKRHRVSRKDVVDYVIEHPGAHYKDIAKIFKVPPNTIGSHLSAAKKDGEVENSGGRWFPINKTT